MNVYAITSFYGHWPVGTAAIVVAENRDSAIVLLLAKLVEEGLGQQDVNTWNIQAVDQDTAHAIVLLNGDY